MKKSIHINITRNASAKNYLNYCKKLKIKYSNVINPRPSGHTEIKYYNLKDQIDLPPKLQPTELKIQPRFKIDSKQQNGNQSSGDPGAVPFWPKDARYDGEMDQNSQNGSILPTEGFLRIKDIINDRNRIATGGSKRGRLEDSFPDAKKRRMSNNSLESRLT